MQVRQKSRHYIFTWTKNGQASHIISVSIPEPESFSDGMRVDLIEENIDKLDKCSLVAVFKDCTEPDIRNGMFREMSFVDFIVDIVGLENITNVEESFIAILSRHEREYLSQKCSFMRNLRMKASTNKSENGKMAISALVNMGFKKKESEDAVNKVGKMSPNLSIQDIVRESLKILT
jgi:hypothetical protein